MYKSVCTNRVLAHICFSHPRILYRTKDWLYFNHYAGSWEAFQRANDIRPFRHHSQWLKKSKAPLDQITGIFGDEARPWVQGFVRRFGEQTSKCLLAQIGNPYNASTALQMLNSTS